MLALQYAGAAAPRTYLEHSARDARSSQGSQQHLVQKRIGACVPRSTTSRQVTHRQRRCRVTAQAPASPEERRVNLSYAADASLLEQVGGSVATQVLPAEVTTENVERRRRIYTLGALFFAMALNNLAKVNLSVAIVPMAAEFGWNATAKGLVSSSFFWGYTLTQLPGGYLSSKLGGKVVLWSAVILFSLGTFLGPAFAAVSLSLLCFSRFLVGLGEGICPSTVTSILAKTISKEERGRAVATVFGGQDVGSVIGLLLIPVMISTMGWQSVFTWFGVMGFVWAFATHFIGFSKAEVKDSSHGQAKEASATPWKAFMISKPVWALSAAHFSFNWFYYTMIAWLPSLFNSWMSLSLHVSATLAILPSVASFIMATVAGSFVDNLISSKRMTITQARKFAQTLGFLVPAVCLTGVGAMMLSSIDMTMSVPRVVALVLLTGAFGFGAWSRAGLFCNHQDLSREYAGVLLGITNTWAAIASLAGVMFTGILLDLTKSWVWSLVLPLVAVLLLGTLVFRSMGDAEPVDF